MAEALQTLIRFPKDLPQATTGVFFPENGTIVTGHDNGIVLLWSIKDGTNEKIFECSSKIETISRSPAGEIVIGSHLGDIVVVDSNKKQTVLQRPSYSVNSRIWRSLWLDKDAFVVTSTYGEIKRFRRTDDSWREEKVSGHSDSVFGIGSSVKGLLTTGDYNGNIQLRAPKDSTFRIIQKIKIQNAIEDVSWFDDEVFVVINQIGKIYLFEKSAGTQEWKSVYEVKDATSYGTAVSITDDGKTVFAGTSTEVIQFEVESEAVGSIRLPSVKKIFTIGNNVFALTSYGFYQLKRTTIQVNPDLIKYKYFKIGVVGHTGVGKSTLCNRLATGSFSDMSSTPGKKIWNWELPKDNGQEKRLILSDHGGQETVLSTFLPFLLDSDIILILWQQTDGTTLKKALEICEQLLPKIADNTKIFFVQTFADEKMAEFDDRPIKDLIKRRAILGNLEVSSKSGKGIKELQTSILNQVSWDDARVIVQTASANGVLKTIMTLQERNVSGITFDDFLKFYSEETRLGISKAHLKLLLRDYSNQGIIEYNPDILDLVIINDPEYNQLRTDIPIFAMKKGGIVSLGDLVTEFKNNRFLPIIDAMYLKYRVAIENFEQRIFPELLNVKSMEIWSPFEKYLRDIPTETRVLSDQPYSMERLFEALSEQKLRCIVASKRSGVFSWEENAIVYYNFERVGNYFDGFTIRCDFRIGGSKKLIMDRLKEEFIGILSRLFGAFIEVKAEGDKKKVEIGDRYIHDVAISYASEQGEYAAKVAEILAFKGVRVFFDKYFKTKMWGKELAQYLQKVYRDESRYCLMLISKEYISKAWPTYELKCAIARSIASMGEYILPIRFDDSEVPGLSTTIDYVRAKDNTPEQIADMVIDKLGS